MSWVNNSEEFKNAHWESYSFNFHQVGVKWNWSRENK